MDVVFCFLIFCFYLQVMDRAGLKGVGCCDKVGYYGMVRTTRLSRLILSLSLVESIITSLLFTIFLPPFSSTLLPIELCVLYFSIVSSCGSLWLILNEFESIGLPLPSSCSRLHVLLTSILVFISLHSHLSLYLLLVLCVEISLILCVPYTPIKPAATRFSFCDFENSFYIYTNYLVYPAGTYQPTHVHSFIPPFFIFPLTLSVSQCFQTPGTSAYELERYGYLTWIPLNWTLSYSVLAVVHICTCISTSICRLVV